jgi:hypothetical protein
MTTRNWRTKSNRAGCTVYLTCKNNSVDNTVDAYIPNTLTISPFTNTGSYTWTAPSYVTSVEYLIVGGGGGGGAAYDTGSGGGGGGGLVLTGTISVTPGTTYSIVVGAGGNGGDATTDGTYRQEYNGEDGSSSSFSTIIALGGGGGYKSRSANSIDSRDGLGGYASNNNVAPTGGNGAGSRVGGENGGGGGGNSSAGGSSNSIPTISRTAGAGLISNISGSNVTYGAGGVGGRVDQSYNGSDASDNTGNGGEGATSFSFDYKTGGNGGSGIVILKYYM